MVNMIVLYENMVGKCYKHVFYRILVKGFNFRQYKQKKELETIKPYLDEINCKSVFKLTPNYYWKIKENFIMYNAETTDLLIKLYSNIYANTCLNGFKTTFLLKTRQLATYNKKLNICKNINSIKSRLRVLKEEGVIDCISTNRGCFYYFLVDISEPFNRKNKKTFKSQELTTTDMREIQHTEPDVIEAMDAEQKDLQQQLLEAKKRLGSFVREEHEKMMCCEDEDVLEEEEKHFNDFLK